MENFNKGCFYSHAGGSGSEGEKEHGKLMMNVTSGGSCE